MIDKVNFDGIDKDKMDVIDNPTFENLNKLALQYSDAAVIGSEEINDGIRSYIEERGMDMLDHGGKDNFIHELDLFYDAVLEGKSVLIEE